MSEPIFNEKDTQKFMEDIIPGGKMFRATLASRLVGDLISPITNWWSQKVERYIKRSKPKIQTEVLSEALKQHISKLDKPTWHDRIEAHYDLWLGKTIKRLQHLPNDIEFDSAYMQDLRSEILGKVEQRAQSSVPGIQEEIRAFKEQFCLPVNRSELKKLKGRAFAERGYIKPATAALSQSFLDYAASWVKKDLSLPAVREYYPANGSSDFEKVSNAYIKKVAGSIWGGLASITEQLGLGAMDADEILYETFYKKFYDETGDKWAFGNRNLKTLDDMYEYATNENKGVLNANNEQEIARTNYIDTRNKMLDRAFDSAANDEGKRKALSLAIRNFYESRTDEYVDGEFKGIKYDASEPSKYQAKLLNLGREKGANPNGISMRFVRADMCSMYDYLKAKGMGEAPLGDLFEQLAGSVYEVENATSARLEFLRPAFDDDFKSTVNYGVVIYGQRSDVPESAFEGYKQGLAYWGLTDVQEGLWSNFQKDLWNLEEITKDMSEEAKNSAIAKALEVGLTPDYIEKVCMAKGRQMREQWFKNSGLKDTDATLTKEREKVVSNFWYQHKGNPPYRVKHKE